MDNLFLQHRHDSNTLIQSLLSYETVVSIGLQGLTWSFTLNLPDTDPRSLSTLLDRLPSLSSTGISDFTKQISTATTKTMDLTYFIFLAASTR